MKKQTYLPLHLYQECKADYPNPINLMANLDYFFGKYKSKDIIKLLRYKVLMSNINLFKDAALSVDISDDIIEDYNKLLDEAYIKYILDNDSIKSDSYFAGLKDKNPMILYTLFGGWLIMDIWSYSKQVYTIDNTFAEALYQTDNLKIHKSILDRLPSDTFFIDFTDISFITKFLGAYVYINKISPIAYEINIQTVRDFDYELHNEYQDGNNPKYEVDPIDNFIIFDKNGFGKFSKDDYLDEILYRNNNVINKYDKIHPETANVLLLVLNLIQYLSVKEPDIIESEKTKYTYKPYTIPRNKFSEVQQWDVGVKYGKKIRDLKEHTNRVGENTGDIQYTDKPVVQRKPHFRNAHWSHRWHGPKNKPEEQRLEPCWIEQTFVGFENYNLTVENDATDITDIAIHK